MAANNMAGVQGRVEKSF